MARKVKLSKKVKNLIDQAPSDTDPQGSYTGRPINEEEIPVQDADDL